MSNYFYSQQRQQDELLSHPTTVIKSRSGKQVDTATDFPSITGSTMSQAFYSYGKFCVCHPWEVIVAFFTLSICAISIGSRRAAASLNDVHNRISNNPACNNIPCPSKEVSLGDIILFTISACLAIIYVHRQFRSLVDLGSKYLIAIATLFTVVSSLVFASGVINLLNRDFSELINSMPLFLLLTQLPKAISLAQFALSSSSRDEVRTNIAKGMAIIGPCLTINTISWTLAIGIGTLPIFSGVKRMEDISYLTCLSFVVNYIIFMTFFPACLSLALELSHTRTDGDQVKPVWQLTTSSLKEEPFHFESEQTPNPVIQRVKIIMSAGLLLVHLLSRWQTETRNFVANSNVSGSSASDEDAVLGGRSVGNGNAGDAMFDTLPMSKKGFEPLILMVAFLGVIVTKYVLFDDKLEQRKRTLSSSLASTSSSSDSSPNNSPSKSSFSTPKASTPTNSSAGTNFYGTGNNFQQPSKDGEMPEKPKTSCAPQIVVNNQSSVSNNFLSGRRSSPPNTSLNNRRRRTTPPSTPRPIFSVGDDNSSVSSEEGFLAPEMAEKEVQTEESNISEVISIFKRKRDAQERSIEQLASLLNSDDGAKELSEEEVIKLIEFKRLQAYQLEKALGDSERGVLVRRLLLSKKQSSASGRQVKYFTNLPYKGYDYDSVLGACCENVIGYMPIPVGVAGPLLLDGYEFHVPMATTEGCLVASTNRGCRALLEAGGVRSDIFDDGMTRAPVVRFPSAIRASEVLKWLNQPSNYEIIKKSFEETSRYARLKNIKTRLAGRDLHIKLKAETGDAMGMNMVSKGAEKSMAKLKDVFPDMEIIGISGNFCTDKKPSAVNWIEGRGKSVVCEAVIPADIVSKVLKTDVESITSLNISKNLIGSAVAGSIGGNNAHAANIVTAIYIATGQDPAQNVGSSNCMTLLEPFGKDKKDLWISCTMPSIECGTIGGGTILKPQAACLEMLGVKGSCIEDPGRNSKQLARIICASVMAAELSLLAATAAGHLVKSHMKHNRSNVSINASVTSPPPSVGVHVHQQQQQNLNDGNRSGSGNHLK